MLESPAKQYAKHLQVPFSLRVSLRDFTSIISPEAQAQKTVRE